MALQKKNLLQYLTEIEICVNKLQLQSSSEEDWVDIEKESLKYSLRFRRQLEDLKLKFLPATNASLKSSSPGPSEMDRSPSSFVIKPSQIQITSPTFSGQEMHTDRMSFQNFLSRFENCVASMANDTERLNFLRCSLSGKTLLLINYLDISNKNYRMTLNILKDEYLEKDEIISNIF